MNCQDTLFTLVSHFGWGRIFKGPEFVIMSEKLFLRYHKIFDEYSKKILIIFIYLQLFAIRIITHLKMTSFTVYKIIQIIQV
jgi:hypothetical protein